MNVYLLSVDILASFEENVVITKFTVWCIAGMNVWCSNKQFEVIETHCVYYVHLVGASLECFWQRRINNFVLVEFHMQWGDRYLRALSSILNFVDALLYNVCSFKVHFLTV
jgi:hypothetical protein